MTPAAENNHRTVVVGVKMDSQSRELLTWALVKVAESNDRVIALHVLNENGELFGFSCNLGLFDFCSTF